MAWRHAIDDVFCLAAGSSIGYMTKMAWRGGGGHLCIGSVAKRQRLGGNLSGGNVAPLYRWQRGGRARTLAVTGSCFAFYGDVLTVPYLACADINIQPSSLYGDIATRGNDARGAARPLFSDHRRCGGDVSSAYTSINGANIFESGCSWRGAVWRLQLYGSLYSHSRHALLNACGCNRW